MRDKWERDHECCTLCRAKGMKSIFRFRVLKVGNRDLYRGKAIYLVRVYALAFSNIVLWSLVM